MGGCLRPWAAKPSKAELLYEQVKCGNVEGIRALHREGAGLEWTDKDGKTPLILACTKTDFLPVVTVLIDLGANVNARSTGGFAGTPLHHAAQRDFVETVKLLLDRGANPLLVNDGRNIPLDLARANNRLRVVRLLESRICLFDGWLMKFNGPSIFGAIMGAINPRWVSTKIWAVILPWGLHRNNYAEYPTYKLAIYSDQKAVQPNPFIPLWNVQITEPDFNQPDPALVIVDKDTKKQYTFLSENEGDKQQLQLLRNACKGIPPPNTYVPTTPAVTPMPSSSQLNPHASATSAGAPPPVSEDVELDMVIRASIESAIAEGVPLHGTRPLSEATTYPSNGWAGPEIRPSIPLSSPHANQPDTPIGSTSAQQAPPMVPLPSAPPLVGETFFAGSIRYPSIDSSPVDLPIPTREVQPRTNVANEGASAGSCVICWNATAEGTCVPCGHKAGCMSCLKYIEESTRKCPICRDKIEQVIKVYDVS